MGIKSGIEQAGKDAIDFIKKSATPIKDKKQIVHVATISAESKELGEITLKTPADEVRRKFRALTPWPSVYFFHTHKNNTIRIKVTAVDLASYREDTSTAKDVILSVIPEGKKEIDFQSFLRGYSS